MDLLAKAFYRAIARHVRLGAKVHAVEQHPESVSVHYRTATGSFTETGDQVICTLPFGVLRHLDFTPPLRRAKYRAIRELSYNPSTKILLQVRDRFWEDRDGIAGGTTTTDLPIRRIVYPSHAHPEDRRAVLLASYTWGQDAARWGALTGPERISMALKDVAKIHPQIVDQFEGGASHAWYSDPHAGGRSRCSSRARRRGCRRTSSDPRGASASRASTAPDGTRGCKVPSSQASARRAPCTGPADPREPPKRPASGR